MKTLISINKTNFIPKDIVCYRMFLVFNGKSIERTVIMDNLSIAIVTGVPSVNPRLFALT